MTLEQLRIFVAVAERQHVTGAARALNLTQSAVSNALAALEERHAVRLFDRVGRGIALNDYGRAFLAEARAVLGRTEAAAAVLAELGGLRRGRLAIAASQTIAGYWLPARLARFHAAWPAIELDVRVGNTGEVARAVEEGAVELGYVEGETGSAALEETIVGHDRLVVLVPPGHPWAVRAPDPGALADGPWVVREPGSGTRSSFEAALAAASIDPAGLRIAMTLPSNEAVLNAVLSGVGVAALSEHVARFALSAGALAEGLHELPARSFRLLRHRERYRTRAAEAFTGAFGTDQGGAGPAGSPGQP